MAKALVKQGAEVHGISFTQSSLDSLKEEVPEIHVYRQDVADWDGLKKLAESLPAMDGLVNNAGIAILAPFTQIEESNFDKCVLNER